MLRPLGSNIEFEREGHEEKTEFCPLLLRELRALRGKKKGLVCIQK